MPKLRILIADDDPIIRLDLKQMLENLDYEVVAEAGDGYRALELARKTQPDICIFDVKMPVMDGIDVAEKICKEDLAPVLLLTAYGDKELVKRAKDAGTFGYLTKPFKSSDLAPAIEVARSRYEQNQQLEREVETLQDKLETRMVVDKAKGVLMDEHGLTESEAYRRLQKQAMQSRRSMREIAEAILLAKGVLNENAC